MILGDLADHLWQSTIVAGAAALLALLLRRNPASVRFWIWFAASMKFLVPVALLRVLGEQIAWPAAVASRVEVSPVIDVVSSPFAHEEIVVAPPIAVVSSEAATALAFTAWAAGALIIAAVWGLRWWRVARVVRAGTILDAGLAGAAGLRVVVADTPLEPGIFGIVRPVLLWPRGIEARLDAGQVKSILAHELAHARRRDNLTAALHMGVQAIFWFHPLVWWIGARLVDERERACDEEVVRLGNAPEVYAEGILRTCQLCLESAVPCVAGVSGSNLRRRIADIINNRPAIGLTAWRKLLLTAAAAVAFAGPIALGGLRAGAIGAPPVSLTGAPKPRFETVAVTWNRTGEGRVSMINTPAGWQATNVTVRSMIQLAWRMQDFQLAGGPAWLDEERIDLVARSAPGSSPSEFGLRLQALLEDRFALKTHIEARDAAIYALVVARRDGRLGTNIKPSTVDCSSPAGRFNMPVAPAGRAGRAMVMPDLNLGPLGSRPCTVLSNGGRLVGGGRTMAEIAQTLQAQAGGVVRDRTGLGGRFDFDLRFAFDPRRGRPGGGLPGARPAAPTPDVPSVFTAVEQQLGLRLEPARGPSDTLVIDSIERPADLKERRQGDPGDSEERR